MQNRMVGGGGGGPGCCSFVSYFSAIIVRRHCLIGVLTGFFFFKPHTVISFSSFDSGLSNRRHQIGAWCDWELERRVMARPKRRMGISTWVLAHLCPLKQTWCDTESDPRAAGGRWFKNKASWSHLFSGLCCDNVSHLQTVEMSVYAPHPPPLPHYGVINNKILHLSSVILCWYMHNEKKNNSI